MTYLYYLYLLNLTITVFKDVYSYINHIILKTPIIFYYLNIHLEINFNIILI